MSRPVIGFAGLSHLGLMSGVAAAAKGFRTIGFHPDADLVNRLDRGELPIIEPDLPELFAEHRDRLGFTADPSGLGACDIVYLSFDVPTDDGGNSDLAPVKSLLAGILPHLAPAAVLVVLCQVPPGFTRTVPLAPERLYYQVETLIFGRAAERALKPERFIIGAAAPGMPLPPALATFLAAFDCPILPMRYESAELAKISINLCLIASVSVANMLSDLAGRLGADWAEIVPALKLDRRIGPYAYLKPGLGLAGGNLERDLASVRRMGDATGAETVVAQGFLADSTYRRDWLVRTVAALTAGQPAARVGLLGLAYKENTASTKNSAALALIAALPRLAYGAYDPVVTLDGVQRTPSAIAACAGAEVLVVATPWPEFSGLAAEAVAAVMPGRIVIDPYAMLDGAEFERGGFAYHTLGRRP